MSKPDAVDLIVRNGTVVTPEGRQEAAICIRKGRVSGICANSETPPARKVINARNLHVLPGLIDDHVHFRDPGMTYKEDFETGSRSAAAGGVTSIIDMPNGTDPPLLTPKHLRQKIANARGRSYVDFGFLAAVVPGNFDDIEKLVAGGVLGLKAFMAETVGAIEVMDDGVMLEAFKHVAQTGRRLVVHAENDEIVQHLRKKLQSTRRQGIGAHLESRPVVSEVEAIYRAILYAETTGARLHVFHISSQEGAMLIGQGKARGLDVTGETCPHYVLLTSAHLRRMGNVTRMNPPVRGGDHPQGLWAALVEDTLDVIGTDHSPHVRQEKLQKSIWETMPGWTGVETTNALFLTEVNKGRMSLEQFVKLRSRNPARVFDLYPRKGCIQIGSDGDLTLVDMKKRGTVRGRKLHSRSTVTPFEGWKLQGIPVGTIVRGNVVMRDGEVLGTPVGQFLKPVH